MSLSQELHGRRGCAVLAGHQPRRLSDSRWASYVPPRGAVAGPAPAAGQQAGADGWPELAGPVAAVSVGPTPTLVDPAAVSCRCLTKARHGPGVSERM